MWYNWIQIQKKCELFNMTEDEYFELEASRVELEVDKRKEG